ncbi:purine-binding chemotaxis protein CheW [Bacillus fengqiuensis]|nr:purine-binding chemotaxis protein CheW [Bacillus fengqiuensis]
MEMKVIVFQLNDEEYCIPVNEVRSIEKLQHITRVPRTAPYVKGVINLRGVVTPIIDLRTRFQLGQMSYNENTRIIIVAIGDMEVGLVVDAANDVIDIDSTTVEPPPEVVGGIESDYLKGVIKIDRRLLILLNLPRVLEMSEVKE